MKRIVFVTGGAGYVGSHTAKALAAAGYLPVTVDNLGHGHREAVRWGPLEIGDLLDPAFLDAAFTRWHPEAVLHFAGLIAAGESVSAPDLYYRNNTVASLNLAEAMRRHGVDRIVFSSTAAVYGQPESSPIPETAPCRPLNPYGSSKLFIERMLADFGSAFGLKAVDLRYFNAAGADPDSEIGEDHEPETHLIPLALRAAANRQEPLTVYGDDYPTPDGTCIRDYIHVADLATAHIHALTWAESASPGTSQAFNLGTGTGLSVRQILNAIERATGRKVPIRVGLRRSGDAAELVADPTRARHVFGWEPKYSGIDTIIQTAWAWLSKRLTRPRADTDRESPRIGIS